MLVARTPRLAERKAALHLAQREAAPDVRGRPGEVVVARHAHRIRAVERVLQVQLQARRTVDGDRPGEGARAVHQRRLAQEAHAVGAGGVDVAVDREQRRLGAQVGDHRGHRARAAGEDGRGVGVDLHAPVLEAEGALYPVHRRPIGVVPEAPAVDVAFHQEMPVAARAERELPEVALQLEDHAGARFRRAPRARANRACRHCGWAGSWPRGSHRRGRASP